LSPAGDTREHNEDRRGTFVVVDVACRGPVRRDASPTIADRCVGAFDRGRTRLTGVCRSAVLHTDVRL